MSPGLVGMQDGIKRRGVIGALWTALQSGFSSLATLIGVIVLARLLSPEDFGLVALATIFVSVLSTLAELGLLQTIVRSQQLTELQESTFFWLSMSSGLFLGAVAVAAAYPLGMAFGEPTLTSILVVLAVRVPLGAAAIVPTALLMRAMDFRPLALRKVLSASLGLATGVTLALFGFGAWALVLQTLVTIAVELLVLWLATPWRPSWTFSVVEAKSILRFAAPTLGTRLLHMGRDRGVDLVLAVALGTRELGVWTVATRIVNSLVQLMVTVVNAVSLPAFSLVQSDRERLIRGFRQAVSVTALISLPVLVGLAAISDEAVRLLFGDRWLDATAVAQLSALAVAVTIVQWLDSNYWLAVGRPLVELSIVSFVTITQLSLAVWAAPQGLMVLAVALLVRSVINVPIRLVLIVLVGKVPLSVYRGVPAAMACCALMYGAITAIPEGGLGQTLAIKVLVGAAVYIVAAAALQRGSLTVLLEAARGVRKVG